MGNSIQISGATFANALTSLTLPDRSDLIAEYVFGGDATESVKNRANSSAPLTAVGAATYSSNSVTTTGLSTYFTTGLTPGQNSTHIIVRKAPSTGVFILDFGNDDNLEGAALGFGSYSGSSIFYDTRGYTSMTAPPNLAFPSVGSSFVFQAGVHNTQVAARLYQYASGVQSFDDGVVKAITPAPIYIGSKATGSGVTREIAYAAIFNRSLSAAEIAAAYTSLKAYLATRGVTVS